MFGVWCEFTNTPPTERFVPQPLNVPSSDEMPTITSWWTRTLRRVGVAGLEALLIEGKDNTGASDRPHDAGRM
jgi:hypothetical protein